MVVFKRLLLLSDEHVAEQVAVVETKTLTNASCDSIAYFVSPWAIHWREQFITIVDTDSSLLHTI